MSFLTYTSVAGTCCNVLTTWIKSTAQNFALYNVSFKYIFIHNVKTKWQNIYLPNVLQQD